MAELRTYNKKRRFDITREPHGRRGQRKGHAYLIQKHAATRLHYDLRLELDGVMKSWAVTRGPSLNPNDKRLAVEVEDHPIEYNRFEGTIPKGQYGGGTVMIWDRGSWEPIFDPHKGLTKGHLEFTLHGEKLHGHWHLVRMHRRPGETRNNWLLIKGKDDEARAKKGEAILEEEPLSVVSGRTMDEIAEGAPKRKPKTRGRRKAPKAAKKPVKKAAKKARPLNARASVRRAEPMGKARLPDFVEPSLATLSDKAPDSSNWIHEIKFDGYRMQARLERGKVKLLTRKGLDWTAKFQAVADAVARLPSQTALLDGEIVVENDKGASDFSLLQQALKAGERERMIYYVFDLLHHDGRDLRPMPLSGRKQALERLLSRASKEGPVRLSESIEESGPLLLKHACKLGLEGIISKERSAPYRSGRGHEWLKTKCSDRQEFVIGGFIPASNDANAVGALTVGYYDKGTLKYAGRVGTGYTHASARDLFRKIRLLRRASPPFDAVPPEERGKNGALWLEPKLVGEVDFRGWTHGDRVRQASFKGLREDKSAKDVVREIKSVAAVRSGKAERRKSAPVKRPVKTAAGKKASVEVGAVRLTHPERVYWEDAGVTKKDLAEYYQEVWKWMAPHVTGRVIALLRCPEGAAKECFFQKHASAGIDDKFLTLVPEPDGDKSISIDGVDGILALAQAGVLEVHIRGSRNEHLEKADRIVFDLDPGPGVTWKEIVAAARDVRERLDGVGLKSFVKTSGGKGLHVVLPIKPASWEKVKEFCRALAEAMEADDPDRYVSTATKAKRPKRIFVDYLRNSREATAVAPYSTRARPGAPVAVPVTWDELGTIKSADQFTILNLRQRLGRLRKDPWAAIGRIKQSLPNAGNARTRGTHGKQ